MARHDMPDQTMPEGRKRQMGHSRTSLNGLLILEVTSVSVTPPICVLNLKKLDIWTLILRGVDPKG